MHARASLLSGSRTPAPFALVPLLIVVLALLSVPARAQLGMGTAFTYQGSLVDGTTPADGLFDFEFAMFDDEFAGTQIGPTLSFDVNGDGSVPVVKGVFTLPLDFGAGAFDGDERWLEIRVRAADPSDTAPYTLLVGRSPLRPAPHALFSENADMLDGQHAGAFVPRVGSAHVVVATTDDAATNGTALLAAYAQAKAMTPHGLALSADNRATVLLLPGRFDVGVATLLLDTQFVDLIGLSPKRQDQFVFGTGTTVIRQTANDVEIENLRIRNARTAGALSSATAYDPDTNLPATVLRNCDLETNESNALSMQTDIEYSGTYIDVTAGQQSFGGVNGDPTGTFTRCSSGQLSFGVGNFSTVSGFFTDCRGADFTFGGLGGIVTGTFVGCIGGRSAFGGNGGTADGTFIRCTGGEQSLGAAGIASGDFVDCIGGEWAFGGHGGQATGTFTGCAGGFGSFGGESGLAGGVFTNCSGGEDSFGGDGGFSPNGRLFHCRGLTGSFTEFPVGPTQSFQFDCLEDGFPYSGNE